MSEVYKCYKWYSLKLLNFVMQRGHVFLKHNSLIYNNVLLSTLAQKLLANIIINLKDDKTTVPRSLRELGIQRKSQFNKLFQELKTIELLESGLYYRFIKNNEEDKRYKVHFSISDDLNKILFNLKNGYTKLNILNYFSLKSKYSIKLYEILSGFIDSKSYFISYDQLKKYLCKLDMENSKFNYDIITPSLVEINSLGYSISSIVNKSGIEFIFGESDG